jgi:hypothetical protein
MLAIDAAYAGPVIQTLQVLAHYLGAGFELFWAANGPAGAFALIGVVGLGMIVVLLCARYLTSLARSMPASAVIGHLREPADIAALLSQSDPDADGHARPRAPGYSLQVA